MKTNDVELPVKLEHMLVTSEHRTRAAQVLAYVRENVVVCHTSTEKALGMARPTAKKYLDKLVAAGICEIVRMGPGPLYVLCKSQWQEELNRIAAERMTGAVDGLVKGIEHGEEEEEGVDEMNTDTPDAHKPRVDVDV